MTVPEGESIGDVGGIRQQLAQARLLATVVEAIQAVEQGELEAVVEQDALPLEPGRLVPAQRAPDGTRPHRLDDNHAGTKRPPLAADQNVALRTLVSRYVDKPLSPHS